MQWKKCRPSPAGALGKKSSNKNILHIECPFELRPFVLNQGEIKQGEIYEEQIDSVYGYRSWIGCCREFYYRLRTWIGAINDTAADRDGAPVEQKQIVEWSEFTGHTVPVDTVDIRPRVSGYIQKVEFQSGQLVKKGDVLFVIDPRWNQAVFDQRQAEYDQAKSEAERIDLLLENHAISKEEADARKARYEEAKAALDLARLDLEYTQVRAPIDGR